MRILHTADWHLGNTFHGHNREDEHAHFLSWLLDMLRQHRPDALLVTGDIFDSPNPSAAAEEMFYAFLNNATEALPGLQIVVTAGNHDSGGRLEAPSALLKTHNIYVRGTVRRSEQDEPDYDYYLLPLSLRQEDGSGGEAVVVVFALPYLRSGDYPAGMTQEEGLRHFFNQFYKRLKKSDFKGLPVVVCAHFYASGAQINAEEHSERLVVGGQDLVDADVAGKEAAYVALGHIHKAQQLTDNTAYAGSALPMSFSEKNYQHGVMMVDVDEEGHIACQRLVYTPLRQLISVPARGAARAGELLELIRELPERRKGDDGSSWPYLEIRVRENQPEPGLLRDVTEALNGRAVHFCRMVRETAGRQDETENIKKEGQPLLQSLQPADIVARVFRSRYGEDMPQPLKERFTTAVEALNNEA